MIKNNLFLLYLAIIIFDCGKEPINYEKSLNIRDGVYYTKDTNEPYNGPVYSIYKSGEIKTEGTFKNGKVHGLSTDRYKNNKKKSELNFKNGLNHGLQTFWYESGEKKEELNYIDGLRNGKWTTWYRNGKKKREGEEKEEKGKKKRGKEK